MHSYTIQELRVGQQERLTKTITQEDTLVFGQISGDHNPIHEDEEYAAQSIGSCMACWLQVIYRR